MRLSPLAIWLVACAPADDTDRQRELFDPDVVQDISLEFSASELAALEASPSVPGPDPYVRATFRYKDVTLENVGVRYKGNDLGPGGSAFKRGYLIKFDEHVPDQELFGLKRLGLDNGIQFGSLFSERLINEILIAEGVPASRTSYARLTINGVYKGVYVNVERVDKKFLKRHFGDNDGNLYKCDEGGPGARLEYLGDAPSLYTREGVPTFEAKTNEDTADGSDVIALARTLDRGSLAEVEAALDLATLSKTMAVMMLSGAFDQATGYQAHNYYLYREPATSRWTYITHDTDVGFADNAFGVIRVIDGWNAATPRPVQPLPLVDRILGDPALLARYRDHAADYLERYFEPSRLGARLDALQAQIEADLASDPYPNYRITNRDVVGYPAIVADLKKFMRRRYDTARAQLGAP